VTERDWLTDESPSVWRQRQDHDAPIRLIDDVDERHTGDALAAGEQTAPHPGRRLLQWRRAVLGAKLATDVAPLQALERLQALIPRLARDTEAREEPRALLDGATERRAQAERRARQRRILRVEPARCAERELALQ
jgi:hypothetical protein